MKIDASGISFASARSASTHTEVRETVRAWIGEAPQAAGEEGASSSVAISEQARALAAASDSSQAEAVQELGERIDDDPVLYFIKVVVEMLTGRAIKTMSAADFGDPSDVPDDIMRQEPAAAGYGLEYDRHEVRVEEEHTSFRAEGVVRTADGRELRIDISLQMSRMYREESHLSLRAGDAVRKDPLVLNFGGGAAQLQDRRFSFDIEGDGKKEQVPLLSGNRGYLALDHDGNGRIDSGKELFGPNSGDGFAELAQYDSDGNGWIDEADPVFAHLKIWMQDGQGGGSLTTLKERGVGALHLGRVATPFELRGAGNSSLGAVLSSGLFLNENGSAGSLQQIDVAV